MCSAPTVAPELAVALEVARRLGFELPELKSGRAIWSAARLFVNYTGLEGVQSVKIATSTSAYPAAGTGTVVNGREGFLDAGTFAYGATVFITITPYAANNAGSYVGPELQFRATLAYVEGMFEDGTGKPRRPQVWSDGKFVLKAADTAGKETDDDLFIDSTKRVKVGTAASPSSIAKTIRIPHGECVAAVDTATWAMVAGYLRTNTANVSATFEASVVLPKGVTITAFRVRMYKQNAGDTAVAVLRRGADDGTQTLLKTLTLSTTAAWTTLSDSLTETVGDDIYRCSVTLNGVANALDARFMWFEFDYTVPDYAVTY